MGIALTLSTLSSPWHLLARWLQRAPGRRPASAPRSCANAGRPGFAAQQMPQPTHPHAGLPRQARVVRGPVRSSLHMPTRVVKVLDGSAPGGSGRLVIAGRMADVCAELDRLALRELRSS